MIIGEPVILIIGNIVTIKMMLSKLVYTKIFFFPYFLIKKGATRFGQNAALPAMAVMITYCPGVAAF